MKKQILIYGLILLSLLVVWFIYDFVNKISDKNEGHFGNSISREEAIKNKLNVVDFKPNKDTLKLLDGREIIIGSVWSEVQWIYHEQKPKKSEEHGHSLHIEFKGKNDDFVFKFELLDKANQQFTNGIQEEVCHLSPKKLTEYIDIILVEKNPEKGVGWKNKLMTDTIRMERVL